jgi:hypothetical protein
VRLSIGVWGFGGYVDVFVSRTKRPDRIHSYQRWTVPFPGCPSVVPVHSPSMNRIGSQGFLRWSLGGTQLRRLKACLVADLRREPAVDTDPNVVREAPTEKQLKFGVLSRVVEFPAPDEVEHGV